MVIHIPNFGDGRLGGLGAGKELCDDGGFEPLADAAPQSLAQLLRQDRQYRAVETDFSLLERCPVADPTLIFSL
jgi:hypothetical protein